jgi:upstream activation factor subunit UAF30
VLSPAGFTQNPQDKREILCDNKLKAVMGGKDKVTMFTMNKYITPHLLEKLDKSYYRHEEDEGAVGSDDE